MRIFAAAVCPAFFHLLPRPVGVGKAALQPGSDIDLLARHAFFLNAVSCSAVVPRWNVREPHALKIRLAVG